MHIGWSRIGHLRVALHENADLALLADGRCAAATERGRPTVIGSTNPGNSTVLRTGTIISASGGNEGAADTAPVTTAPATFASATTGLRLVERDYEAAIGHRSADSPILAGRKS
jgi:hypothetical protein